MEAIQLAETMDRYLVQRSQGFHRKQGKFGKKYLAALGPGDGDGEARSSDGENEGEMFENEDTT